MPRVSSFVSLASTSDSPPRRAANWRRSTGFGIPMLILAEIWVTTWLLAALAFVGFGAVSAAHDTYLNSVLIESTCRIVDSDSDRKLVHKPPLGKRGNERVFFRINDSIRARFEVGDKVRKVWFHLDRSKRLADYPIGSVHPVFYDRDSPSTARLDRPNAFDDFSYCLVFATPLFLVSSISWLTLNRYTRDQPTSGTN